MGVLYVISGQHPSSTVFEMASKESADVSILFIAEARGLAREKGLMESLDFTQGIYSLDDGSQGVDPIAGVELVDYSGWVKLIEENDRIVSWT